MGIEHSISIKAIREFLFNVIPDRKYIDKDMINNVRIRVRKIRLVLEISDIEIDPKHFDTSFITTNRDTFYNYTEGKFLIVMLSDLFSQL